MVNVYVFCSQEDSEFDLLLQWWVTTNKYDSYQPESVRVCQVLQKMAKGDKQKIDRFAAVAYQHFGDLGFDAFTALFNTLFM